MTDVFDGLTRFEPHDYVVLVVRVIETMTVPVFPVGLRCTDQEHWQHKYDSCGCTFDVHHHLNK